MQAADQTLKTGWLLVARREVRRIARRPALWFFVLVFPILIFLMLASIFRVGVPTDLPVAVVDLDRSALSRQIVQAVDAMPEVSVAQRPLELAEARQLLLSGKAYGVVLIPAELERDVRARRSPEVVVFYNNQFMTPGSTVARGVQTALANVSASIGVSMRVGQGETVHQAMEAANPIPVQQSPLFNPTLDYVHFLLAALMPAVLQIFICAATAYAVALERQKPGGLWIMLRLGGGMVPAMLGKLLPYTAIFAAVLAAGDALLFYVYGTPFNGSMPLYLAGGLLFILAYQMIGVVIGLAAPTVPMALGAAGILTAPALGFIGISFPRLAMGGFATLWSALLPLTWYTDLRVDQMLRGAPLDISLSALGALGWAALITVALAAVMLFVRRPRQRILEERAA
ncbi:MAG TPA: ABC transporter permease [Pelagibacterium sp.]|uniref:ABC transporter permease n=1 Tax=Pelagibacterium sp. TaxID=1967288 RepID=UPI002C57EE00|nr:ABC transporter permease [Pelagibacterium sp.]HWJ86616.1 ABC transporter permease [Pelagibacterium sp.]